MHLHNFFVCILWFIVVATTKKNANVALIFSFLHKLVKVS